MFKVQRNNRDEPRSGERIDFKFSNFQAIQVPKGWDKLLVSVVSVDTGKTIAKSSKAHVKNGNCQWTETLSESIWTLHDEERFFKFVVSMGSARSSILGEITVNVSEYITKKAPQLVLMPLEKCNYGTILQVKIQCLTPKTKLRGKDSNNSSYSAEDHNGNNQDLENKSDGSDNSLSKSSVSLSSNPGELISREASFSSSGSHPSFSSAESYTRRGNVSIKNDVNGGRQNSSSSVNSSPHGDYHAEDSFRFNSSPSNSRASDPGNDPQNQWQESAQSSARFTESASLTNAGSSKNYLEVAEDTINELRGEAKMWERNSRKLMADLDILKTEFSDLSKKQENYDMELSAACAERDGLIKEVEQLKLLLEETMSKQVGREDPGSPSEGSIHVQKEMETEIKYQQECNADLTRQLKRSQESNIELVDILHELEETIEKQKADMENFSAMQMKVSEMENSLQEKFEANKNLLLQLQESEKDRGQNNPNFGDIETEYRNKLLLKDKEIENLERKLSDYLVNKPSKELDSSHGSKEDLIREIDSLKEKLEELEQDCNELTNENMELLYKLKDLSTNCTVEPTSPSYGLRAISFSMSKPAARDLSSESQEVKEEQKETTIEKDQIADLVEQLQMAFQQLKEPWYGNSSHLRNGFKSEHIDLLNLRSKNLTAPKEFVNSILNSLIELNKLLEARIDMCGELLNDGELKIEESKYDIAEAQQKLEDHILKEKNLNLYIQELESINTDLRDNLTGLEKELIERGSAITTCEAKLMSDDEEIRFLRRCQEELEAQICDLRKEKDQTEENMDTLLKESQKQKSELEEENIQLLERVSELSKHVEDLEEKIAFMLEDFSLKENNLTSEYDALLKKTMNQKEKLALGESLLIQIDEEKKAEVENLQREIEQLKEKISSTRDEGEIISSEAAHEISSLRASNARLESSLQEIQSKFKLAENEIDTVRKDSEFKVQDLMVELSTMRKNHELLVAGYEKKLNSLGSYRSSEEKMNTSLNDLELKLTVSECERQQLIEEIASLKTQLQEAIHLQDEILTLESELNASIVEKKKLEVSLDLVSREREELKSEKLSFLQKVNRLESVIAELEECKGDKVALEEKLRSKDAELEYESSRLKRLHNECQLRILELEVEKDEYCKRIEALEEQLNVMEDRMKEQNRSKKGNKNGFPNESPCASETDQTERVQWLENELAQALETNNKYKIQLHRFSSEGKDNHANGLKEPTAEVEVVPKESLERTKSSLETELIDLRERYFNMSLQYAEVEAQREDLVMKLKASKSGKKWF